MLIALTSVPKLRALPRGVGPTGEESPRFRRSGLRLEFGLGPSHGFSPKPKIDYEVSGQGGISGFVPVQPRRLYDFGEITRAAFVYGNEIPRPLRHVVKQIRTIQPVRLLGFIKLPENPGPLGV
jgi:hypothetical protein